MIFGRIQELLTMSIKDLRHSPALSSDAAIQLRSPGISDRSNRTSVTALRTEEFGNSVLLFARDSYYWSPSRILRLLWGISSTALQQLQILRLMRVAVYADFLQTNPRFRFKFLIRDYLVRDLSTGDRTACFLSHYKRLHANMSANLLYQTLHAGLTLFENRQDDIHIEISLCFSRPFEKEGELSLNLHVDGYIVFVLSFTIIPGSVVQSEAREVLLISRLQGTNGYYPQIRAATKAMQDIAPVALLLAALHGFAEAFDIDQMAGVSAIRQSTYTEELSSSYRNSYDGFFSEIDIPKNSLGFFLSSIPPEKRPMSAIKQGHKIRTRKKRQLKRQIADDVCILLRRS